MATLYEKIEDLCETVNINITQMCREAGISRASLSELKMGRSKELSNDAIRKISDYFGVSVDYLLNKTDKTELGTSEYPVLAKYRRLKSNEQDRVDVFIDSVLTGQPIVGTALTQEKTALQEDELRSVYLSFAKDAQDNGLDPEDIKTALALLKSMKAKRNQQEE